MPWPHKQITRHPADAVFAETVTVSRTILYVLLDPILGIVLSLFGAGVVLRWAAFASWMARRRKNGHTPWPEKGIQTLRLMGASLVPFHRCLRKEPISGLVRYLFHACLFLVPLGEAGHIILLERKLGIGYKALPAGWIDLMALLVIGIGCGFAARRIFNRQIRRKSSLRDYVFILITVAPFATGLCYTNGLFSGSPAVADAMLAAHVGSGCLMILTMVFLFVRTRLDAETCVGCAACVEACPTGTLETVEQGEKRTFLYSHCQCICCGGCRSACPEGAAGLGHDIGVRYFLELFRKQPIRERQLTPCAGCNDLYAPDRQLQKLKSTMESTGLPLPLTLGLCNRCKKMQSRHPWDVREAA